ncbi:RabGAP/TBC, partial [Meira miltonrushii]
EDADGAYVRRTYAHFDARGVRGDGLLEGKEWTRERGAHANGEERAAHHHNHDGEIDVERNELMKKIDRYGFFPRDENQIGNSFARSRMTILPEAALSKIPKRRIMLPTSSSRQGLSGRKKNSWMDDKQSSQRSYDASGSNDDNEAEELHSRKLQAVIQHRASKELAIREREALRTAKWDHMLDVRRDADGKPQFLLADGVYKSKKLKRRVYKGIPDRWRAAVWWALLRSRAHGGSSGNLEADFHYLQRQPSPHDVQIDLDVPRTISGHILFHTRYGEGQRALFHVLHSFSLLCDQCAYCQGMGPIAATLLVYFPPERAYAALVQLHNDESFGIHQTFSPGFPGLVENFWVQYKIAMMLCPDVVQSLEEKNIVTSAYATKWYITLFTNVFPFATQLRLWDAYFLHGRDVLVIASVAIIWSLRRTLVTGNFETCLGSLGREFIPDDDDLLMNWIFMVLQREDIRKTITSARKEWAQMVEQG